MATTQAQKARGQFLTQVTGRQDPPTPEEVRIWMVTSVGGVVFTAKPSFNSLLASPDRVCLVVKCGFVDGTVLSVVAGPWQEWELNRMNPKNLAMQTPRDRKWLFQRRAQAFSC